MDKLIHGASGLREYLQPETPLEKFFLEDPPFIKGLMWGTPRFGHPEGKIVYHIREVLDNVEKLTVSDEDRTRLRIITFVHDTFKYEEHKGSPRDWKRHHSILAKQYLEKYCDDQVVLDIVELHDEAYYCWRLFQIYSQSTQSNLRLKKLVDRIGENMQLYYLFFKCDTCTGDKNLASLYWAEENLPGITITPL